MALTAEGNIIIVHLLWKTAWWLLKILNIELPFAPAIPLLSTYSKELKSETQRDICTSMFTAALFAIA